MSVEALYTNAYKDFSGGNYDLAYQEFSDCVKYFPSAILAANCQFYIGDIYYRKKDYAHAIEAYDAVLEHFSDGSKTPDAHLMKAMSMVQEGKRDAAAREWAWKGLETAAAGQVDAAQLGGMEPTARRSG